MYVIKNYKMFVKLNYLSVDYEINLINELITEKTNVIFKLKIVVLVFW